MMMSDTTRASAEGRSSLKDTLARSLRSSVKLGCALTLHASGLANALGARRGLAQAPVVLGYHRVVKNFADSAQRSIAPQLTSVEMFQRQLEWMAKRYEFVSLDDLVATLEGQRVARKPIAAITFDDGYEDFYTNAMPVLMGMGIPSAIFVCTELTGNDQLLTHDEVYLLFARLLDANRNRLDPTWWHSALPVDIAEALLVHLQDMQTPFTATRTTLEFLTQAQVRCLLDVFKDEVSANDSGREELRLLNWDQLRHMHAQGVTIGSHTKTHALLANLGASDLRAELEESRRKLETELGTKVHHLAYPDGRFNEVAVDAALEAGYRAAYTVCRHRDERHLLMTIPRTMLWENACLGPMGRFSKSVLNCQINGIFDPAAQCSRMHTA